MLLSYSSLHILFLPLLQTLLLYFLLFFALGSNSTAPPSRPILPSASSSLALASQLSGFASSLLLLPIRPPGPVPIPIPLPFLPLAMIECHYPPNHHAPRCFASNLPVPSGSDPAFLPPLSTSPIPHGFVPASLPPLSTFPIPQGSVPESLLPPGTPSDPLAVANAQPGKLAVPAIITLRQAGPGGESNPALPNVNPCGRSGGQCMLHALIHSSLQGVFVPHANSGTTHHY